MRDRKLDMPIAAMAEELHGGQDQSGSGDVQKRDGEGVVTIGMSPPPKKLTKTEALEPDVGAGATMLNFDEAAMAEEFHGEQDQSGSGDSQKRDSECVVTAGMTPKGSWRSPRHWSQTLAQAPPCLTFRQRQARQQRAWPPLLSFWPRVSRGCRPQA